VAIFGKLNFRQTGVQQIWAGIICLIAFLCLHVGGATVAAAERPVLQVAVLKFGTVSWELDVIRHHGLDKEYGFRLDVTELASTQATKVALMSGSSDMIVSDWLWVSRQRASGFDISLVPFSSAAGALIAKRGVRLASIDQLKGMKIGVAGGPLDKSWLFLNAFAKKRHGFDLKASTTQVFAAPPLLNQLMIKGDVDVVLNYWNYSARLEAAGYTRVMEISDVQQNLTRFEQPASIIGYTFNGSWAKKNAKALDGFFRAAEEAREILFSSDEEWDRIAPLIGASSEEVALTLRQRYREGIPVMNRDEQVAASSKLFDVLVKFGGAALVGKSGRLSPGTFWKSSRWPGE